MRLYSRTVLVAIMLGVSASIAMAEVGTLTTYTFLAPPKGEHNLCDLPHERWITWGIGGSGPAGVTLQALKADLAGGVSTVVSAKLYFENIYNWNPAENNDVLYMHVIDDAPIGLNGGWDWQNPSDHFAGQGILISIPQSYWTNLPGYPGEDRELEFAYMTDSSGSNVQDYIQNNPVLGLGFDPDCHFYNDGVRLEIQTYSVGQVIPLPSAIWSGMGLFGGLGLVAGVRRRMRRASCNATPFIDKRYTEN